MRDVIIDIQLRDRPVEYMEPAVPHSGGGECVFLGRTRREVHPEHGELMQLAYESYRPLAEQTMRDLAEQAVAQFGCLFVRLHHAVGDVPVGAPSVLVQVICGHRAEAFAACRFLIDELKKKVPIWKREVWADGSTWAKGEQVRSASLVTSDRDS